MEKDRKVCRHRACRFWTMAALWVAVGSLGCPSPRDSGGNGVTVGVSAGAADKTLANDGASSVATDDGGPFLRVLGTAQDGGLPHAACSCIRCEAARHDPGRRRLIASLALVLPGLGEVYLIDASPDLRAQLDALVDVRDVPQGRVDRHPIDGVFLTHAHIGHYLGLAFFGFEAVHTQGLPVHGTARMHAFLRHHGPWSQLVERGNVQLVELPPEGVVLANVRVSAFAVPHRDELSDTVAFRFVGPERTLLYVPDTDAWHTWSPSLVERLEGVDIALLDGTFYSLDELPGRDISQVKHPLITDSMIRLNEWVASGQGRVFFTHLNHSNPALEPNSEARREIEARGFAVLEEGQELGL